MRRQRIIGSIVFHLVSITLGFIMIYPILWLFASSLKGPAEIFTNQASLIPLKAEFSNYTEGWKGFGGITFATFFKNSFIITIISTIAQVLSSAVVAYGFARIPFKGVKIWFGCVIVTLLLPNQILIIPQYIMFNSFGWVNTFYPLIVPGFFGMPFFIFLIMQFIQGIPVDLDESAYIDGCSRYAIFFRIILPLIKPALVTSMIFAFYWKWDDFFGALLYIQSVEKYPISYALKMFADPSAVSNWGAMYAMSVLSLIPIIVIFFSFQRYLVEGISTTGLKG